MDLTTTSKHENSSTDVNENSGDIRVFLTLCQILNLIMLVTLAWILISMIAYGKWYGKWTSSSDGTNLHKGNIYIACVVVVACCFPRLLITQVLFTLDYDFQDDASCEAVLDVGVIVGYIALWLVYFFLWLRHRAIYAHPTVKSLMGRHANVVSWILLLGLSGVSVGVLCGFTIPKSYVAAEAGCVIESDSTLWEKYSAWNKYANYVLGAFLLISQTSFVALFVYPMILTKRVRNSQSVDSIPEKIDTITKTVYRSIIGASLTICTDLLAAILVALAIPKTVPRSITFTVYDVSLWLNVFCITATFGSNRAILFVFFRKSKTKSSKPMRSHTEDRHTIGTMAEEI